MDEQYGSEQHRALGDVDDSSLCVSPLPSNAKTAWLIKCAGLRPSCANCDMLHSEGSLLVLRSDGATLTSRDPLADDKLSKPDLRGPFKNETPWKPFTVSLVQGLDMHPRLGAAQCNQFWVATGSWLLSR